MRLQGFLISCILFAVLNGFAQGPGDDCVFVVLGDSISDGGGEWGYITKGRFPNAEWHMKAVGGYKTTDIMASLNTRLVPYFETNKTNRAFLLIGVNDFSAGRTIEQTIDNYTNLAQSIINHGFDLTCLTMYSWPAGWLRPKLQALNAAILDYAPEIGYAVVDIWDPLLDFSTGYLKWGYNAGDGHVNGYGSRVIANYVEAHIESGFIDTRTAVITVASAHGRSSPRAGTYAYLMGSSFTCSVDLEVTEDGRNWTCIGWTGEGSIASSGNGNVTGPLPLTNLTSSITWHWRPEYEAMELNGELTITGYNGSGGDITIPASLDGEPVVGLGDSAFWGNDTITTVTLPSSIVSLGTRAFNDCPNLKGLYVLGDSPPAIGSNAFLGSDLLTVYYYPGSSGWGDTYGGHLAKLLPFYYSQSNGKITITGYAGSTNSTVDIPASINGLPVVAIGAEAFASATYLTAIYVPETIQTIGAAAFSNCVSLTEIDFTGDAPVLGSTNVFFGDEMATVYHLEATGGWGTTYGERPSALWSPLSQLTIQGGSGSGSYADHQHVAIFADPAPVGQTFDRWVGATQIVDDVHFAAATLTMADTNVVLAATYRDVLYALSVMDGTGDGAYLYQARQTVEADPPEPGQIFDRWVGDTDYLSSLTSTNAMLIMPAANLSIAATYVDLPRFTVDVSAMEGGTVSPVGSLTVYQGQSLSFEADPDPGYRMKRWFLNDVESGRRRQLTLENISESWTLEVHFEKVTAMPWLNLLLE